MRQRQTSVEQLAGVLSGMARAREIASAERAEHVVHTPKPVYPMSLLAVQLTINPFEFLLLVAMFITGLAYVVVGLDLPNSINSLLGKGSIWPHVWAMNLFIGSGIALTGGLWRKHLDRGLMAYQVGWGFAGLGCLTYGIAILVSVPATGLYTAMTNLLFAAACLMKVKQIQRFLRMADLMQRGLLAVPSPTPFVEIPVAEGDSDASRSPGR